MPSVVIRTRFYRVTGMTESDLDTLISPAYKDYTNPATTVLASAGDIQVDGVRGSLTVDHSGSGDVEHRNVSGRVTLPRGK